MAFEGGSRITEEDEPEGEKPPETEEEEDRRFRDRQNKWREREREMLDALRDRTFTGWTDKDWRKLNALYWAKME